MTCVFTDISEINNCLEFRTFVSREWRKAGALTWLGTLKVALSLHLRYTVLYVLSSIYCATWCQNGKAILLMQSKLAVLTVTRITVNQKKPNCIIRSCDLVVSEVTYVAPSIGPELDLDEFCFVCLKPSVLLPVSVFCANKPGSHRFKTEASEPPTGFVCCAVAFGFTWLIQGTRHGSFCIMVRDSWN